MHKYIAVTALALVLGLVNWSIAGKEKHLSEGEIVYLELAPVDPRSLMQGDYMALSFVLANQVYTALPAPDNTSDWNPEVNATDGAVVVSLDQKKVGTFVRIYDDQPLAKNEILMRYRVRNGRVKFATNAFFFQEGHAQVYELAKYGEFRVDDSGELLLVNMFDHNLNKLVSDQKSSQN